MQAIKISNDDALNGGESDHAGCVYRAADQPKACCHPVKSPNGHVLTGYRMSDHPWHRGLWFTIKYINGTNFWEEKADEPFGCQSPGEISGTGDEIKHDIVWKAKPTGEVLTEKRTLHMHQRADGLMCMDWISELIVLQDLVLDRTPFTIWGGYTGLSIRGSREMHQAGFLIDDESEPVTALSGRSAPWCAMQARFDGGPDEWAGMAILDHPSNPRYPVPWYCKAREGFTFMNAAFLFHEPLQLQAGKSLNFHYRVLWRDGKWDREQLAGECQRFHSGDEA